MVDLATPTVAVHTGPQESTIFGEDAVLAGGPILTDFALPLRALFAELDRVG